MPTYDYRCSACGHVLEVFQSISEARKRKCPRCKKPKLERLIGQGAGILFKGSGFYQTDYRSDAYKKSESAEKPSPERKAEETKTEKPKSETPGASPAAPAARGDKPAAKQAKKPD